MKLIRWIWFMFFLGIVWGQVCGCNAEAPVRSHAPTSPTDKQTPPPETTPLELGKVRIPAGEFLMGSEKGEDDERPVHKVFLDAYEIDQYEVTNEQYARFMKATDYPAPPRWNNSAFNHPQQPVVEVNWFDAVAYCKWAGGRLPTEAEWEKAARGGLVQKAYPWGDDPPDERADFGGRHTAPLPVGSFPPNGYGLYDCAGSVWEWCLDWYDPDFYWSSPRENPVTFETGGARVLRGGAWNNRRDAIRVANRNWEHPKPNLTHAGFRCARDIPKK